MINFKIMLNFLIFVINITKKKWKINNLLFLKL